MGDLIIKQALLFSETNQKNQDPSYKMDLGFWDCFTLG